MCVHLLFRKLHTITDYCFYKGGYDFQHFVFVLFIRDMLYATNFSTSVSLLTSLFTKLPLLFCAYDVSQFVGGIDKCGKSIHFAPYMQKISVTPMQSVLIVHLLVIRCVLFITGVIHDLYHLVLDSPNTQYYISGQQFRFWLACV